MAIKSAYREKTAETPNIPDEPIQPSASTTINFNTDKAEPVAAIEATADEATQTLLKQIADLKKSEELQKHVAAARAQPPTREQKLEYWRSQGMDDQEFHFLSNNPELVDKPEITQQAAAAALRAGLERGTDEFNNAVKLNFDTMLGRTEAQAQPAAAADPAGFFQPPRQPVSEPAGPASYVSAPVSRRDAGSPRELNPRQVKLSAQEQQIARASGISDVTYAANKLRMLRERAAGERD